MRENSESASPASGLPESAALASRIEGLSPRIAATLAQVLIAPARDLAERPSKRFRADLVTLGFALARGAFPETPLAPRDQHALATCQQAIELLHAGALIVDDIQDGSAVRRGAEAAHMRYGMPRALCAGNWLYFWPLRLIATLGLSAESERSAFRIYGDALERAHYGQALDLGLRVDELPQEELGAACRVVTELKTGEITALAMALGAIAGGATEPTTEILRGFGRRFGGALQLLDDLGNALGRVDPEKRFEDFVQRKPTGLWGEAACFFDEPDFARFRGMALALPEGAEAFVAELAKTGFEAHVRREAARALDEALSGLARELEHPPEHPALIAIHKLARRLTHAYG